MRAGQLTRRHDGTGDAEIEFERGGLGEAFGESRPFGLDEKF